MTKLVKGCWATVVLMSLVTARAALATPPGDDDIIGFLHQHIQHVICIAKTGRTFDEVLGDITNGANADPSLAQFGRHTTPNAHRIAANFVTFDHYTATASPWMEHLLESASRVPGLTLRNYGVAVANIGSIGTKAEPNRTPFANGTPLAKPGSASWASVTDVYFRGQDPAYPDTWRADEWQREFARQIAGGAMPALTLISLTRDRIGALGPDALADSGTPETEVADNDFAFGRIVGAVAHSPYAASTLIFAIEGDGGNGPDHIDGHRSLAYFVGAFAAQTRVLSTPTTAEDFIRTIEQILAFPSATGTIGTLREAIDTGQASWRYNAVASTMLRATTLLESYDHVRFERKSAAMPAHDGAYWGAVLPDRDISAERFNQILWTGLNSERPYPSARSGARLGQQYQETP